MIYTITLNPSLDYRMEVSNFELGKTNRAEREGLSPGGKGINVSIVLRELGVPSRALGFLAGMTGKMIEKMLEERELDTEFVFLNSGFSRINVKLESYEGTEINGSGPAISENDFKSLLFRIGRMAPGDTLVLSGSMPGNMPENSFRMISDFAEASGVKCVFDVPGKYLKDLLITKPFLIKPNADEVCELLGEHTCDSSNAMEFAQKLSLRGASNVIISLGGEGAAFYSEDGTQIFLSPPPGTYVGGVGAGDSMVAGFLAGLLKYQDKKAAFALAVAAGSATAYSDGLADLEAIEACYHRLLQEIR